MKKLEAFLAEKDEIIKEDRDKTLTSLGLTEKEYSPDDVGTWKYPQSEFVNGEIKYYREVPIKVTDEEYAQIIEKINQVEAIKSKEKAKLQEERDRRSAVTVKKWIPVFTKPKPDLAVSDNEKPDDGRSTLALVLRIVSSLGGIIAVIAGIAVSVNKDNIVPALITAGSAISLILIFYTFAAILDYLAELTSIARNGYKYSESQKTK